MCIQKRRESRQGTDQSSEGSSTHGDASDTSGDSFSDDSLSVCSDSASVAIADLTDIQRASTPVNTVNIEDFYLFFLIQCFMFLETPTINSLILIYFIQFSDEQQRQDYLRRRLQAAIDSARDVRQPDLLKSDRLSRAFLEHGQLFESSGSVKYILRT